MSLNRSSRRLARRGSANIYTVLALVAAISLATACGVVWIYATQLTGQSNPFALL